MISLPPTEIIVAGITLGGVYALAAFGLSLIFGVSKVLNITHGEFIMLGAFTTYILFMTWKINPLLLTPVIFAIFLLAGFGFERLIERVLGKPPHEFLVGSILVTFGIALAIEDLTSYLQMLARIPFILSIPFGVEMSAPPHLMKIGLSPVRLLSLALLITLTILLSVFLKKSREGLAIRASVQDREGALMTGINIRKVTALTFGIGTSLTAVAGTVYILLFTIEPSMGLPLVLRLLCIVVLGGLGSLIGSLIGGLIIGVVETLTAYYIAVAWSPVATMLVFILILLVKPQGLFGHAQA